MTKELLHFILLIFVPFVWGWHHIYLAREPGLGERYLFHIYIYSCLPPLKDMYKGGGWEKVRKTGGSIRYMLRMCIYEILRYLFSTEEKNGGKKKPRINV